MEMVSVMTGRAEEISMVCGPSPEILKEKEIVSAPLVLLAAIIASRREILPSAPLLAFSHSMVWTGLPRVIPLSFVSLVVLTNNVLMISVTVTVTNWVSLASLPSSAFTCIT